MDADPLQNWSLVNGERPEARIGLQHKDTPPIPGLPAGRAETLPRGHTCVPLMPTGGPGELGGEAVAQVENGPRQDDDVVYI